MKTSCKVWNIKVHHVSSYCLSKEKVDSESWKRVVFKRNLAVSRWLQSETLAYIFMPVHLLRAQTWENLNIPSLKPSWFLWRRLCSALWGEKLPTHFSSNFKIILHRCRSTDPVFTQWPCKEGQTLFTNFFIKKLKQRFSMILNMLEKSLGSL